MDAYDESLRDENDEEDIEDEASSTDGNSSRQDACLFDCLVDGCTVQYRYYANLLRHYATGKHTQVVEKYSLIDKSKILFHQNLTLNQSRGTPSLSITVIPPQINFRTRALQPNWASQKTRTNVRFNERQKAYLEAKFNEGVVTGSEYLHSSSSSAKHY